MMPVNALRMRAQVAALPSSTWDSATKGADFTLSSADMRASNSNSGFQSVYATNGRSSGKYAFELEAGANNGVDYLMGIANKANTATVLTTYIGNNGASTQSSFGYWGNGRVYRNSTIDAGETNVATFIVGSVITVAVDMNEDTVDFYKDGSLIRTEGIPSGQTWFPAAATRSSGIVILKVSSLSHLPSGFTAWG